MRLLSVDAARERMLAGVRPLGEETVFLAGALRRFLAEPVLASRDQPPFAASAMDGWAVRACDGEGPRRIVGESAPATTAPAHTGNGAVLLAVNGAVQALLIN